MNDQMQKKLEIKLAEIKRINSRLKLDYDFSKIAWTFRRLLREEDFLIFNRLDELKKTMEAQRRAKYSYPYFERKAVNTKQPSLTRNETARKGGVQPRQVQRWEDKYRKYFIRVDTGKGKTKYKTEPVLEFLKMRKKRKK